MLQAMCITEVILYYRETVCGRVLCHVINELVYNFSLWFQF